jgi:hypothetical protein
LDLLTAAKYGSRQKDGAGQLSTEISESAFHCGSPVNS